MTFREPRECEDRYKQTITAEVSSKDIRDLYDWLYQHYGGQGYKFVLVFDVSGDEYCPPPKNMPIYMMDDIMDEFLEYADLKLVDNHSAKRTRG